MADIFSPQRLEQDELLHRDSDHLEDWELNPDPQTDLLVEHDDTQRTFWPLQLFTVIILLVFTGRLLQLQVAARAQYRDLSAGNSIRALRLPADRGLIYDDQGNILARNAKRSSISLVVERLPETLNEREQLYAKINSFTPLSNDQIKEIENLRGTVTGDYVISTDLNKDQVLLAKELGHKYPAVVVQDKAIRQYDTTFGLSQVLGYVGQVNEGDVKNGYGNIDQIGKTGIEKTYENKLRGITGVQEVEVDSTGQTRRTVASDQNRDSVPGLGLKLGIDKNLQQGIADLVKQAIDERNKQFGISPDLGAAVVALDPQNGLIKALVSYPSYDNNLFSGGISSDELNQLYNDPGKPLFNRVTNGAYPPGSTIKPLIATGALHYHIVSPSYAFDTPPAITVGDFTFPDWKDHGVTNIRTAIAESNNVFFYMLGGGYQNISGLGLERIRETLHWFGLESPTGIDTGSESDGFVLSEDWKRQTKNEPVYLGDVYHLSIGQGDINLTPIQLTAAVAAITNGGTLYKPHVVDSFVNGQGQTVSTLTPEIKNHIPVDPGDLKVVQEGMRQAVVSGSSRPLNTLSVKLAGKTGTAQYGNTGRTHAWFTGYGPYEDPNIVITVLLEGGGESFDAAIPLAENIFRLYFNEQKSTTSNPDAPTTSQ